MLQLVLLYVTSKFCLFIFQYEEICSQLAESLQVEDICDVDQMITKVCLSLLYIIYCLVLRLVI